MFTRIADVVVFDLFGLEAGTQFSTSVHFFVYDLMLISVLLAGVMFLITALSAYIPPQRLARQLAKRSAFTRYIAAACMGMITPFCSCSAVPLFIGIAGTGISAGTSCTFLVASPLINEIAVTLLLAMFGWRLTLCYVVTGLIIAVVAGALIDKLNLGRFLDRTLFSNMTPGLGKPTVLQFKTVLSQAAASTGRLLGNTMGYVAIAIAVGAVVHGYVPTAMVEHFAANMGLFGVPTAVLVGVPLYSGVSTVIPVASTLVAKGVSIGVVVAFTMSVTALSLPEFIMLKRVMKAPLLIALVAAVAIGITIAGYTIDLVGS